MIANLYELKTRDKEPQIRYPILQLLPLSEVSLYCDKNEFHNEYTVLLFSMTPKPCRWHHRTRSSLGSSGGLIQKQSAQSCLCAGFI
jgi:hypothetical protein